MVNIAIVGGGPIGLILAVKIDKYNYNVEIYEKREKYLREQFLVFGGTKSNFISGLPEDLQKKIIKNVSCHIKNPVYDLDGFCYKHKTSLSSHHHNKNDNNKNYNLTIEIKTLENILLEYISKNENINIIKKEFTKNDSKKYDIIIGADGQKSFVREKLMKVKWKNLKNYEAYILHIKYTDLSNKKYNIPSSKNILNKTNLHKIEEKIEQDRFRLIRSNTNKTQFLLQIDKTTYNKIKNIKVYGELPSDIKNTLLINSFLMGSQPTSLQDNPINIYNTKVGHSEKYAIIKNNKIFFLIGDSAMTTHVFTGEGLNVNYSYITDIVTPSVFKHKNYREHRIKEYNTDLQLFFDKNIKYKAFRRYLPHKILKTICKKVEISDVIQLFKNNLTINRYEDLIKKIYKKYKNIPDTQIKNELCFILRDNLLKYYTFEINNT